MKQFIMVFCLFFTVMAVQANGIKNEADLSDGTTRTSYAFGMTVGVDLKQAGLEIDYPAFLEGLKAAMESGETLMGRDEAVEIVQGAFENAMERQAAAARVREETFLERNSSRPEVTTTGSGLQYEMLEEGNGSKPSSYDTVRVHYEGALTSGLVFDSSYERGEPEDLPLNMVIPGWAEGIQLMNTGSKYRIYIPSSLAYGERNVGQIPPYSTLVFVVELLDILPPVK
jgi:FKBP-type peptidyl-prolyl cis-trans isomerase FkpA